MNETIATDSDDKLLHNLLQETGMLVFRRSFLDPALYELTREKDSGDIRISLILDASKEPELVNAVRAGQITTAAAHLIRSARCRLCGEDYETCPHVKFEEEKVGQECDSQIIAAFWTNRRA